MLGVFKKQQESEYGWNQVTEGKGIGDGVQQKPGHSDKDVLYPDTGGSCWGLLSICPQMLWSGELVKGSFWLLLGQVTEGLRLETGGPVWRFALVQRKGYGGFLPREKVVKNDQALDLFCREEWKNFHGTDVLWNYLLRFYFSLYLYFFIIYSKEKIFPLVSSSYLYLYSPYFPHRVLECLINSLCS